jgi:Trypsin-co-occurring domain 1
MSGHDLQRAVMSGEGKAVAVLMRVPVDNAEGAASVLVEVDSWEIPGGLVLAPEPGRAAAAALRSLSASPEQLEPVLRTVKEKLVASAPEHFTVEFGVKLGSESGIILAKGTAEVNLKITMTWDRERERPAATEAGASSGKV